MKKIAKSSCLIALVVFGLLLVGCGVDYLGNPGSNEVSCSNIVMGNGKFTSSGDFIYFTDYTHVYEYDLLTGTTISINAKTTDVRSIYIQDEYIYFASNGLRRIRKDGKKSQQVFEREQGCLQLFVDKGIAYYLDGIEGNLYQRNLKSSEETKLLTGILSYYVDDTFLYAVANEKGIPQLYISEKDNINFEVQTLSFTPICVYVKDDVLYLSERGSYQIIRCVKTQEERLPIYSTYFQVIGEKVFYLDSQSYKNGCFDLKSYDLQSEEQSLIYQSVYDFGVIGKSYLGIQYQPVQSAEYYLYNLDTCEILRMK